LDPALTPDNPTMGNRTNF